MPDPIAPGGVRARRSPIWRRRSEPGSVNAAGGVLERGAEQFVIRSEGLFAVAGRHRRTARGHPRRHAGARCATSRRCARAGRRARAWSSRGTDYDAVEGIVLMRRGENPSAVLERLRAREGRTSCQRASLPTGVTIEPFYDRTELVDTTLAHRRPQPARGRRCWSRSCCSSSCSTCARRSSSRVLIPLSLLAAFIYLHSRGMSANLLSMGAVDFGIIVDGAVVIIESIVQQAGQHERRRARRSRSHGSSARIRDRRAVGRCGRRCSRC